MSKIRWITLVSERIEVARELLRVRVDAMSEPELDLAMALLLRKNFGLQTDAIGSPLVNDDRELHRFSPTTDWNDYGEVVTQVQVVTSTHALYDDPEDEERVTGNYYRCHGFFGGVESSGRDLRKVVGQACAKLLVHELEFGREWRAE